MRRSTEGGVVHVFWLGVGMLACAAVPAVLWASFGLLLAASLVVLAVSVLLKVAS